jgi:hypothetical protein
VKIKKRDLIQIIREMAYMGMPNIQTGQTTHLARSFPENSSDSSNSKRVQKINYFFKSKNWHKRAQSFSSAFPNSNVWVIPQVGDMGSDELQFDKEEPGYDLDAVLSHRNRGNFYNINKNLLRSLGMPEEVISGVRLTQDIIFVPRNWRWEVDPGKIGSAGFSLPTPHMIFHALFDGGALFNLPEVMRAESTIGADHLNLAESIAVDVLRDGIIKYVIAGIDPDNSEIGPENFKSVSDEFEVNPDYFQFLQNESFTGMKAPITASLRSGDIDMGEVLPEILTGCLLYNRLEKIEVSEKLDKWMRDQTGMSVKELLSSAVKASRDFLKGKIVIVNI